MSTRSCGRWRAERGVGLMEVMISLVIGMLLVLVIYQVYEISESQKRTITSGSDAQQNASYGVFVLGRDISMAGNGIASAAASLDICAMLRPIPVLIDAGAGPSDPDTITVLYGGSSSLSTPVQFKQNATGAQDYVVPGPVGFSQNDVIAAVQGANCTLSTINPGGVAVDGVTGFSTIGHTLTATPGNNTTATYNAVGATLINLGQAAAMGRVAYTVDTTGHALRTQNLLPTAGPVNPVINDVVNLKAQYGLDTNNDGSIDAWQDATGGVWSAANLPAQPLATLQQIRAVRIAIVTRSAQYEKDALTAGTPPGMPNGTIGLFCDPAPTCAVTMTLAADDQHYRYKVLETSVPLRNAMWN
ncbi:MAG: PilW family protein [Casimicrobiaceae bacterium]